MRTWQEALEEAKMPASVLVIDFESFYDGSYHLGRDKAALSTCEYVADSRFELHGFGLQILNHKWSSLGPRFIPQPKVQGALDKLTKEFGSALHNVTVVAANCKFDGLILAEKYGLFPPFTIDIQDLARYYNSRMSHKLKDLAPKFGLPHKGETSQFKGKHFAEIDLKAMENYCLNDVNLEVELFKRLLPIIDNIEIEAKLMRHTLGLYLRPKAIFDFELASRIRKDMQEQIDLAVKDVAGVIMCDIGLDEMDQEAAWGSDCWRDIVIPELSGDISFARLIQRALPAGESLPVKPGKPSKNMIPITGEGMIPAFSKTDDGCKALLDHKDPTVKALMAARMAVSSWPNHIGRINKMAAQAHVSCGFTRVPLVYYGCHTGRWSGDEGVNLGNLGGSGRGKAINKLIGEVRHTIRAEPGSVFVLCDAKQIEARDLAHYAGQQDLLEGFRNNADIYSEFATDLFQVKVWNPSDEEKKTPEGKRAEIYRGFGKDAILGCGYGMGCDKFYARCLANDVLRPLFDSGEYDKEFVGRLIRTYRTKYAFIPEFWDAVERAWRVATRYHREETVGRLSFWNEDDTTFLRLPSGRILWYHGSRVNSSGELSSESSVTVLNPRGKLWGGSLTENIVQSTCRDYLGSWILQIESDLHMPVVHHVYDETITMVPEDQAENFKTRIVEIMSRGPEWAGDMPFAADPKISPFYKK